LAQSTVACPAAKAACPEDQPGARPPRPFRGPGVGRAFPWRPWRRNQVGDARPRPNQGVARCACPSRRTHVTRQARSAERERRRPPSQWHNDGTPPPQPPQTETCPWPARMPSHVSKSGMSVSPGAANNPYTGETASQQALTRQGISPGEPQGRAGGDEPPLRARQRRQGALRRGRILAGSDGPAQNRSLETPLPRRGTASEPASQWQCDPAATHTSSSEFGRVTSPGRGGGPEGHVSLAGPQVSQCEQGFLRSRLAHRDAGRSVPTVRSDARRRRGGATAQRSPSRRPDVTAASACSIRVQAMRSSARRSNSSQTLFAESTIHGNP
jgi:hypothetical protein